MIWGFQIREAVFVYFSFVIPLAGDWLIIFFSIPILLDSRFAEFVSLPRSYREFRITYVCKWWVRRRGDAPLPGNGGEVRAIRDSNGRGDLFIFSPSERRSLTGVFAGRPSRSGDRFDALKFCSSIFSLSPSLFFPFYPFFPRENRSFREFSAQQFRLNF